MIEDYVKATSARKLVGKRSAKVLMRWIYRAEKRTGLKVQRFYGHVHKKDLLALFDADMKRYTHGRKT